MEKNIKEYYKIMGIAENATDEDIKTAYRKLCFELHPDRNHEPDANQRMVELNNAYAEVIKNWQKVKRVVGNYLKKKLKVHLSIPMLKESIREYYLGKGITLNDILLKHHLKELIHYFLEVADDFALNNSIHLRVYNSLKNEVKFTVDELKGSIEEFYSKKEVLHSNHWKNKHLDRLKIKTSLTNSAHESIRNIKLEEMLSTAKSFIKSKYLGGDETKTAEVFSKPSTVTMWEVFVKEYHPIKKRKINITQILQESKNEILSRYFDNDEHKLNLIFTQQIPLEIVKVFNCTNDPIFEKKHKFKKGDFILSMDTDPIIEVQELSYFIQIVKHNSLNYLKTYGKMPEQKDTAITLEDKYIKKIDNLKLDDIFENFSNHHPILVRKNAKVKRAYNDTTIETLIRYSLMTGRVNNAEDQFLKLLTPITVPADQQKEILNHTIERWRLFS